MTMMTHAAPLGNALSLRDAMDQLFRDSFVAPFGSLKRASIMPVDVYENDDAFVVKAFMPGLAADDLTITVEQQAVTIHGEPKVEELNGLRPLLQERPISAFTRTIALPVLVDADRVEAELVNGVLRLTLPKSEAVKPHKILVKSS